MLFWNSLAFSMIQWMLAIWSLVPLPYLNPAWTSESSRFMYCWSLAWRVLSITLLTCAAKLLQSCPTLCNLIDGSPLGFSVPHYLWVGPSSCPLNRWYHPTISSSAVLFCFCFNLSQHQGLFQWVGSWHRAAKVLELQLQHQSFQWVFRVDYL